MTPALSSRLLRHVTLPLALTWARGSLIAVLVGDAFTEQAFDSALLDDAYAVSANVRQNSEGLDLGLTDDALDAVLFDQSETLYFAVLRDDDSVLAGQAGVRSAAAPAGTASHAFSNIALDGHRLRAGRLRHRDAPGFSVIIAQTTSNRNQLLQRLVAYAITPQLLLLLLVGWGLRRTIQNDLAPLAALQRTLDQRDANDLTPVPPDLIRHANSREVERLGVAVDALLGRIGDGVRAQREFAGNVAHELRTPLAGIRALAEYGLAQTDPSLQHAQFQTIIRAQSRTGPLVDQLLALALADESRAGLQLAPVALDAIVRDVVLHFMPRADAAGVDLGAQGLERPLLVTANAALVEGMLTNLLDNAMRYGRDTGGRAPVITVGLARDAHEARLSVVDNGPGLRQPGRETLRQRRAQGRAANGWAKALDSGWRSWRATPNCCRRASS
jgi:two-component system sensor histidine kinase TctE